MISYKDQCCLKLFSIAKSVSKFKVPLFCNQLTKIRNFPEDCGCKVTAAELACEFSAVITTWCFSKN